MAVELLPNDGDVDDGSSTGEAVVAAARGERGGGGRVVATRAMVVAVAAAMEHSGGDARLDSVGLGFPPREPFICDGEN
jgi:hypothetical protein